MIHKSSWQAAKSSGLLTAKNYVIGATFLGLALFLLNISTGTSSIQNIGQSSIQSPLITLALVLLLISSMTQSSLWPFHRWLVSSLNSPTPVSAIMHAGLINGGFFLLARFAPLFFKMPGFLTLLFVFGIATALLGTLWKLMQSDIKRMLACSTMGQMGFMLAQCGLGLFPAALAHLITHGMFKAYLFLASGSASHEKRHDISYSLTPLKLLYSLMCGMLGSFWFALTSGKTWFSGDTTLVLMVIALITSTQFAIPILMLKSRFRVLTALIGTSCVNIFYGFSVQFISNATKTMEFSGCVEKFYRESLRKTP